ncbi:hypothetical protein DPMN_129756 [Dreissena polymorpha]|uniref:Uncharacterized protein n=1 Tax=Dreissena polymorpha TaxID=45954 RepID=A0A9D4H3A7_DREPO|nr:hypothetical protein DPMN_129756 [Dreissena polymorpha]
MIIEATNFATATTTIKANAPDYPSTVPEKSRGAATHYASSHRSHQLRSTPTQHAHTKARIHHFHIFKALPRYGSGRTDGRTDGKTDGRTTPKQYPSAYGGG